MSLSLEDSILGLYQSGMTQDEILTHIFDTDAGRARFIDPIANSFGKSVTQNIQQVRHNTRDEVYNANLPSGKLYRWVLTKENNCPDCIDRASQGPRSLEEWESIGLPQTGTTICGQYCGCELEPIE